MKTLKHEEVDGRDYCDISAARESLHRGRGGTQPAGVGEGLRRVSSV
jgi:hypothetical protein